MKKSTVILMVVFLCSGLLFHQYERLNRNLTNKERIVAIDLDVTPDSKYRHSLTFKMIDYDVEHGITDKTTSERAKANVSFYYEKVNEICRSLNDGEFLACANELLGQYFYYTESVETSNNYAKQQSDCDLNSYLIYDVSHFHGVDTSVMYSPHHAFISWKDQDGSMEYLETTGDFNHGHVAELSGAFYKKTPDII